MITYLILLTLLSFIGNAYNLSVIQHHSPCLSIQKIINTKAFFALFYCLLSNIKTKKNRFLHALLTAIFFFFICWYPTIVHISVFLWFFIQSYTLYNITKGTKICTTTFFLYGIYREKNKKIFSIKLSCHHSVEKLSSVMDNR